MRATGTTSCAQPIDQTGHRHRLADAAQARQLPAPERTGRGLRGWAGSSARWDWLQSVELRRRAHAGLNKGEARNSLARAVFFNRLGKSGIGASSSSAAGPAASTSDGGYRAMEHGVSERATRGLVGPASRWTASCCNSLSPLGWEHINLTGDYVWQQSRRLEDGEVRPLRMPGNLSVRFFRILRAPLK